MMNSSKLAYLVTVSGYFALLILLMLWLTWLSPPQRLPVSIALLLLVVPLLFPLRGLLHGRLRTFAWSTFLALFYLIHGTVEAYSNPADRIYAILELLFALEFYLGALFYCRIEGRRRKGGVSE